ncbi:MAG: T9SS C-terminal target domain-containing protein, partial [Bacteroidetes bacterium]
ILNTSGQIVLETALNQPHNKIKLGQGIPEGIYFVQVYDANNVLIDSKKIIKQ